MGYLRVSILDNRSFVVCVFLVYWAPICATGSSPFLWKADCEKVNQEDGGCTFSYTECSSEPNLTEPWDLRYTSSLEQSSTALYITPVFYEKIENLAVYKPFCREDRWYPGLNITWLTGPLTKQTRFFGSIKRCEKFHFQTSISACKERCFYLTVKRPSHSQEIEKVTLSTKTPTKWTKEDSHVYVRIRDMEKVIPNTLEAAISLPVDIDGRFIFGIPTSLRDKVPLELRNMSTLNPLHWTTSLQIWNSSCTGEIRVRFDIIPENLYIRSYFIFLVDRQGNTQMDEFVPAPENNIGIVSFMNISEGVYYIKLRLRANSSDHCPTITEDGIKDEKFDPCSDNNDVECVSVTSGYIHILDRKFCLKPKDGNGEDDSSRLVAIGLGVVAAVILVAALAVIRYNVRKDDPADPPLRMKIVLILYCKDNLQHNTIVLKFANLLHTHGHCNIIIDEWDSKGIHEDSSYNWLLRQIEKADKIIVVGSEGAHRIITARKREQFWPALESKFLFSNIFPLAVKLLQNKMSAQRDKRIAAVGFEYTEVDGISQSLRDMTGTSRFYRLTRDLGVCLQFIHDDDERPWESFKRQAIEMMTSEEGKQLMSSISLAKEFQRCNKDWFTENYGQAEPIPNLTGRDIKALKTASNLSQEQRSLQVSPHDISDVYLNCEQTTPNNNSAIALLSADD